MADSEAEPGVEELFSAATIAQRVAELARSIAASGLKDPMIVAVLKGSFIFAADLIRALQREGFAPEIDFIFLASYGAGTESAGEVRVLHDVASPLQGRDVVIVDDILDSGRTLALAKQRLEERGASRVLTCVLIDKQVRRAVQVTPDFSGFSCGPVFVVGYGMDLDNRYRELPFIGTIAEPNPLAV